MSAGLAVVWHVSFLNKFCWILIKRCSNQHAAIFMNETNMRCFQSVFKNRITSSWHQKSKISKRIVLIYNRYWYKLPKIMPFQHEKFVGTRHSLVVITVVEHPADPQIDSRGEPVAFCRVQVSTYRFFRLQIFQGNANIMFWPKNQEDSQTDHRM